MRISVNGEEMEIEQGLTLRQFLQARETAIDSVIVEYNGQIVSHERWSALTLQEGDSVEVLVFLGGG